MFRQVCDGAAGLSAKCCCAAPLAPEDEIRMLEAVQSVLRIRMAVVDRRLHELEKARLR